MLLQNKRYSLPNSRIMIHQPLGGAQGQAADIEIQVCVTALTCCCALGLLLSCSVAQANEILHHKTTLNGYLAEFTGQPEDKIYIDTDRDFFLSAQARALSTDWWPAVYCWTSAYGTCLQPALR